MSDDKPIPALSIDALTPLFDACAGLLGFGTAFKQKVVAAAEIRDGEHLLDVGCGTGTLLIVAKQQYPHSQAIGIDPDARVLEIAQTKTLKAGVQVELIRAGGQSIPLADSCVDVALSSLIFHHLPPEIKQRALQEIYRVLKREGRFLLADFGRSDSIFFKALDGLGRALHVPEFETVRDNREGKLPLFLKEAGFQVKEAAPRYRSMQFLLATKQA